MSIECAGGYEKGFAMATKFIENTKIHTIFIGGKMIPAGEWRDIDVRFLPPEQQDKVTPVALPQFGLDEPLVELLTKPVKDVLPALNELTLEALDRVVALEDAADTPRKTVLTAAKALQMTRVSEQMETEEAEKHAQFEAHVEAVYNAKLALLTPEQLQALDETGHAALLTEARAEVNANDAQ